jgi:hypothetical protein
MISIVLLSNCSTFNAGDAKGIKSCKSLSVVVGGITSWKKRNRKTKKIKTFSNFSEIGTKWNSNDDFYEKIVIKSNKKISSVSISIKSKDSEKKVGTFEVLKKDAYEVLDFSFKEEITKKKKPFILRFNINLSNKKTCQHIVQVKQAE